MSRTSIVSFAEGDVTGDHLQDYVYIVGTKSGDRPYYQYLTLRIKDGNSQQVTSIPLKTNQGYAPKLFLGDFTGNGVDDIFISIQSGGSGGFGYFYVYSFLRNQAQVLFDYEKFNESSHYTVLYQNHYNVLVTNNTLKTDFVINLSNRSPDYLSDLYHSDGTLMKPLEGSVSGLNQAYPIDFDGDGTYDLFTFQRVVGQYNADGLGTLQTPLKWQNGKFSPVYNTQYVAVVGQNQRSP